MLGLTCVPGAGDTFLVVPEDRIARQIAERRQARERNAELASQRSRITLEDVLERIQEGEVKQLNLILKGDVSGSVEALEDALLKIDVGDRTVTLRIIDRGVGAITENDVNLASRLRRGRSSASTSGPRARRASWPSARASTSATTRSSTRPSTRSRLRSRACSSPSSKRSSSAPPRCARSSGPASSATSPAAWSASGTIGRNSKARLVRDGIVVADNLTIESLKRFKDDATEVREGFECGIGLGSFNDIKIDDVIETFELREKPRA